MTFFFFRMHPPPRSTLFPYTTLFRSDPGGFEQAERVVAGPVPELGLVWAASLERLDELLDRKSTRLNSSHRTISYAVFCLKKKIAYAASTGRSRSQAQFIHPLATQLD